MNITVKLVGIDNMEFNFDIISNSEDLKKKF